MTTKRELEIKALELYCQALQIWIDNNKGVETLESSNPPTPPPPPPGH